MAGVGTISNSCWRIPGSVGCHRVGVAIFGFLAVESHEVGLGQAQAADGRLCLQASMWPVPVIAVQPVRHVGSSLI